MMQINQDTYKEGELNFGMYGSPQRDNVFGYRFSLFKEIIGYNFPEHVIRLSSEERTVRIFMRNIKYTLPFKYSSKMVESLTYNNMESVNSSEFETIMKRFERFLKFDTKATDELKKIFN